MSDELPGMTNRAVEFWDEIIADMEATAAEYEEADWEAYPIHPGDVATRSDEDEYGLDVLVPDDEFEQVEQLLEDVEFDSYEVYRATSEGLLFALVAMEASDDHVAVLIPTYYDTEEAAGMLASAEDAGTMYTYLRTLTGDRIQFTHDDPAVFMPADG